MLNVFGASASPFWVLLNPTYDAAMRFLLNRIASIESLSDLDTPLEQATTAQSLDEIQI